MMQAGSKNDGRQDLLMMIIILKSVWLLQKLFVSRKSSFLEEGLLSVLLLLLIIIINNKELRNPTKLSELIMTTAKLIIDSLRPQSLSLYIFLSSVKGWLLNAAMTYHHNIIIIYYVQYFLLYYLDSSTKTKSAKSETSFRRSHL